MQTRGMQKTITREEAAKRLTEKAARAEKAAQVWNNHPLFKGELSKISEAKVRQNAAINLTNQARFMKQLNEQETSAEFQRMAPANMMRLVQMTMTNLNRGNVFSEYSMETARDAIYYVKQFFSKPIVGTNNFAQRSMEYNANGEPGQDPYGFSSTGDGEYEVGGYNGANTAYGGKKNAYNGHTNSNARKAVYETKESRFANELANATTVSDLDDDDKTVTITWSDGANGFFGENGEGYVPGSTKIYFGTDERNLIAFQDPNTLEYLVAQEFAGTVVRDVPRSRIGATGAVITEIDFSECKIKGESGTMVDNPIIAEAVAQGINAYARYESETDYEGKTLGEVQLNMSVYELRPRRTSIGVSWTKLAEVTLDSTFNSQVDDMLLTSAANTIQAQMDLQAFKDAYSIARTNPAIYKVTFDAGYSTIVEGQDGGNPGTKDSYAQNAQTLSSAIDIASAALYSDIHRGAINKLVVGVSVTPYLKLNLGFEAKGVQDPAGVYKIGELDGIEVFQAPTEVLPDNEILCVYKNAKVDNDVAIVFGTLVPFVSNKLEYPTFYTRAGLASFGDKAVLNPKYLARVVIENLKDRIAVSAR